ncbi:glycosyltransferase family 2 protein [Zavarzinella formosa]|uniref:glycosyltransferase family 2 protein n=1 Tax=Zavarzinella formosa TaxID=360055 RepID=UPI0003631F4B|nr:glycosyltransferase family 2 protein [Zavarzinella formosa]
MNEAFPTRPAVSLVIPVLNERESLPELHRQISMMAAGSQLEIEILFIDDGSRDGSWEVVKKLAAEDPRVRGVRFRRNFAKAAALQAGFQRVRGKFVVTLDADLQDDPAEIPNFLKLLETEYDLVSGWKKIRHDPFHKVIPSRVFNGLVSWLTGVKLHDHNCGMKGYRAEVCQEIRLYGELHRFVPVLANARGFRVGELVIHHRPRQFGRSKYGLRRFLRGLFDLLAVRYIVTYGRRPMHWYGSWALLLLIPATAGIFWEIPYLGPLTYFSLLLAALVYLMGLQAETLAALRTDEPYSISEEIGFG